MGEAARCTSISPADILGALLTKGYSCRAFQPRPVERATIERILTLAQHTATWCNTQPWQVYITSGPAADRLREALHARASNGERTPSDLPWPREYRGKYLARRREAGLACTRFWASPARMRRAAIDSFRKTLGFSAPPHMAMITTDEQSGYFRKEFGLSLDRLVVCGISSGYADDTANINKFRTTRAPIADAAIWIDS